MKSNHIGIENFTMRTDVVGKGGMASVYLCQDEDFVAKKLSLYTIFPWMELYIMQSPQFHHENLTRGVVKLKYDGTYIYQSKALGTLKILKGLAISRKEILSIMKQIVKGVVFLHSRDVVHCDLKPSNILVFQHENPNRLRVKISDFGLSTKRNWFHQSKIGSAKFRAPEANDEGWDERIDIWGLGHILYYLLTQKELFGENYQEEKKHFEGLQITGEENKDLWEICRRMLEANPENRIAMKELSSFFGVLFIPLEPTPSEYTPKELRSSTYKKEVRRVRKSMEEAECAKGAKYRRLYNSIGKQMVLRGKMPSSCQRCFDEIQVFVRLLNKVIF